MVTRNLLAATAAAMLLAGCAAPGPKVRVDRDPAVDLTRYETFAFFSPLGTDRAGYETRVSDRLKAATRRELESRGYRYDERSPQLLVNFGAKLTDKVRVSQEPRASVGFGYYGYRAGYYANWPLERTRVDTYQEGTLNIDIVDASRKELVWEGIAAGRVTQKALDDLDTSISNAVRDILASYPSRNAM